MVLKYPDEKMLGELLPLKVNPVPTSAYTSLNPMNIIPSTFVFSSIQSLKSTSGKMISISNSRSE